MTLAVIIKGPLYSALNVTPHKNTVGESVGVPMAILAEELTSYDTIDEKTHQFLSEIATDKDWIKYYYTGEWDSVKWIFGGTDLLMDADLGRILKYTCRSVIRNPKSAFYSFSANTKVITSIIDEVYWNFEPYVDTNEFGIKFTGNPCFSVLCFHFHMLLPKKQLSAPSRC